jgi:glycosyltransferase involved in cell wall biosynthesis
MRIAMLSPIAWRTPPRHYGPWERVVSLLTEGLVARGVQVTLFATADSVTSGKLHSVCAKGYEESDQVDPKVCECIHISEVYERAGEFDLIHNHFDFLPLTYSGLVDTPVVTTIHGFSSSLILPVFEKYNGKTFYVAISEADRSPNLDYIATVHHGIDLAEFTFRPDPEDYLLFFGRIHPDKGAREAVEIAAAADRKLILAGIIQDQPYFETEVEPFLDGDRAIYAGSVGPEERNRLLGGAAALLHPIYFNEPFGLSVVEAMACGTPVIAFNRGSMPELIRNGVNGYLATQVEDAVECVSKLAEIDRSACRRFVEEHFSIERMVDGYLAVYRKILDQTCAEQRRPWGHYTILSDTPDHKVKRIAVYPGKRLSLQRHRHRAEHWYVVAGDGRATLDGKELRLAAGDSIDIPRGATHRMENPASTELVFVEVQTGEYFGEDDIERLEDDFGRV